MIEIKTYSNGSYSYWSKEKKCYVNIRPELGKAILELQKELSDYRKEEFKANQ